MVSKELLNQIINDFSFSFTNKEILGILLFGSYLYN
ncbi:hypothetical protein ES703_107045 [subsurface metagenome]